MLYIIWMQCKCNEKSVSEGRRWCARCRRSSSLLSKLIICRKGGEVGKGRSGSCAGVDFMRFVMLWRKVTYIHTAKGSRSSGE